MEKAMEILKELIEEDKLSKAILSDKEKRSNANYNKVNIKPVTIKGIRKYQFEYFIDNKVVHENLGVEDSISKFIDLLRFDFRQGLFKTVNGEIQLIKTSENKFKVKKINDATFEVNKEHNREKNYILKDGEKIDFLMLLGVMDSNGKVYKKKYDKFKQINKFLEIVNDIFENFDDKEKLKIVDFGCGKSYLTFALYYYLTQIKNVEANIVGLDLKEDVINYCNQVKDNLKYNGLKFICSDIKDYKFEGDLDLVVTLHACDTATDIALVNAIKWNTKVILSVPCCQHELFDKINNIELMPMLKHGIIKERLNSLVTDSLRGLYLEKYGYQVNMLEFIDMEHTPKNIMIRAIKKSNKVDHKKILEINEYKKTWNLDRIFIDEYIDKTLNVEES
ncbi:MAG: SAM-dependent methyltransferase [Tissierellales bacterium]|nr:SAM-dependent methyltransferase [Tissierellales bacterium]